MKYLTESLETLHDIITGLEETVPGDEALWEGLLDAIKLRRARQREVRALLVEDALFRKACGGDVRACITWLKYSLPEEWGELHQPFKIDTEGEEQLEALLANPAVDRELMG